MASHRRRLAQDQAAIRNSPPPDYFFADDSADDLTGLSIYLVGPTETPFESGVFTISLRIPTTYPQEPPKANFATKIFHPNVDDRTGDVCVDTLKRDWNPKLTLHDVLVTIRCLLVYPNPTSSLNEAAGKLLLDNYEGFARHARLMTEVHAAVPEGLKIDVGETRLRDTAESDASAPLPSPEKLITSSTGSNTALKQAKHKRQPSKPTATTVPRKIRRAVSPKTSDGHESDSDGGDSGKENVVTTRPRPISPPGIKRSREEPATTDSTDENEKGVATKDAPTETGRKSPKLREGANPGLTRKAAPAKTRPRPTTSASASTALGTSKKVTTSAKPMAKKSAPKVGLKRF